MTADHLVLAGGGHSHALMLRRWAMRPQLRPAGLITLINRHSTTLYSGMVPGLIAGHYRHSEIAIDLRRLTDRAGVSLIIAEITAVEAHHNRLLLAKRPPIHFQRISFDVGAETFNKGPYLERSQAALAMPIKPLEPALAWLEQQDSQVLLNDSTPLTVIGAGLAGVEVALALRQRWPKRPLNLQAHHGQPRPALKQALSKAAIVVVPSGTPLSGPALLCTGSQAPAWLATSGFPVDPFGRVRTTKTLQVINHPHCFAVGDCAVIDKAQRPAAGVWAVQAAKPLAQNLERLSRRQPTRPWQPQQLALQILGGQLTSGRFTAWAFWGNLIIGPHPWLWYWKEAIDRRFMGSFNELPSMSGVLKRQESMACRGCAAKLAEKPLNDALKQAGLGALGQQPEDAALIASTSSGDSLLQSVDGFPALISDPWLNGRLTTLHACSDLWASGAHVISAQAVITLPKVSSELQQELLVQTLKGIQSTLEPQGAKLIGGHTLEARSIPPQPINLGIQLTLSVNGKVASGRVPWSKGKLQSGDVLLLSRPIGSGVIFAAAMAGEAHPEDLDAALAQMTISQHNLLTALRSLEERHTGMQTIHACTDITGFGLLGHLGEMLSASNHQRHRAGLQPLRLILEAAAIPSLQGALPLLKAGYSSTLAPANRRNWHLLNPSINGEAAPIEIALNDVTPGSEHHQALLELMVDPQTCGPLLLACSTKIASELLRDGPWQRIGQVQPM